MVPAELATKDANELYANSNPFKAMTKEWFEYNRAYNKRTFEIQQNWSREKYRNFIWREKGQGQQLTFNDVKI